MRSSRAGELWQVSECKGFNKVRSGPGAGAGAAGKQEASYHMRSLALR